jgi:predicted transcriptional regulator
MRERRIPATKLDRFIRSRRLSLAEVVRASDVCRSRLLLWRVGKVSPMLSSIRKLVKGVRKVTNDPAVTANDLFSLDDDE